MIQIIKRFRLQNVWEHGAEIVGTIFRVLVFYVLVMMVLIYSFPQGTGLGELYRDLVVDRVEGSRLDLGELPIEDLGPVAVISKVRRTVTDRAASEVAWKRSTAGKDVLDRHAIQTRRRSTAEISFGGPDTLKLGEKSLVVIRRPENRREQNARPSLLILGGQVRGTVSTRDGNAEPLRIETGGVTASVRSTSAEPADFSVTNNPDDSSTVSVYSGEAKVTAQGQTELVGPMQTVTVEPGKAPSEPVAIPDAPQALVPPDESVVTYGMLPPQVRFGWTEVPGVEGYRFVIAHDPEFDDVIHEETLSATSASHGRLRPGRYYWSVSSSRGRAVSSPSAVRRLEIRQDLDAPPLRVDLPTGTIDTDVLTIRGTSEPGARITIAEQQIPIDANGRFEYRIRLEQGPNLIALTAVDPAGNVAYYSEYIAAEF